MKKSFKLLMLLPVLSLIVACSTDIKEQADVETEENVETEIISDREREQEAAEQEKAERDARLQERREARLEREAEQAEEEKVLSEANPNKTEETEAPDEPISVPEGEEEAVVNDNIPYFSNEDITSTEAYHRNGPLDSLGRVTAANAVVGVEIMPAEEREDISGHEPTGWDQARYADIGSGGWLYNRSHLIGHQLTGNDDYTNLMTGTRWFNERMLEYQNFVANYVETTENHVRYRVTPVFEGNNLLASGAYMEGFSIEDNGEGLRFNIYIPNIQPGVEINYTDGSSVGPEGPAEEGEVKPYTPPKEESSSGESNSSTLEETPPEPEPETPPTPAPTPPAEESTNGKIKGNINSEGEKIYHVPGGAYYDRTKIDESKGERWFDTEAEAEAAGWRKSQR